MPLNCIGITAWFTLLIQLTEWMIILDICNPSGSLSVPESLQVMHFNILVTKEPQGKTVSVGWNENWFIFLKVTLYCKKLWEIVKLIMFGMVRYCCSVYHTIYLNPKHCQQCVTMCSKSGWENTDVFFSIFTQLTVHSTIQKV